MHFLYALPLCPSFMPFILYPSLTHVVPATAATQSLVIFESRGGPDLGAVTNAVNKIRRNDECLKYGSQAMSAC